ncbi:MAG: DNA/RNA non-specific endonuclease [Pseudomonadota bacterium]
MGTLSNAATWFAAIPIWVAGIPWAKILYTLALLALAFMLLFEVKRLWWNDRLYVGRFGLVKMDGSETKEETDIAARIVFWHRELRHHFAHSSRTQFSAEAGLSPTAATPIEEPESVLSEVEITVQSINVTAILDKLRTWVSAPREITGDVVQTGEDFRATVRIGDGITHLADGTEIGPSQHLASVRGEDKLAFEIACGLVWRQAAASQETIARVPVRDFCNWAAAWVAFLKFDAKSRQLESLAAEDVTTLHALRERVSKILKAPDPYLRFLDLRANVARLLLEFETDDLKRRDLTAEMQQDRFRYLVRLKVDPRAGSDLDALQGDPNAMKVFAGMRPALPIINGKLNYDGLSALDTDLKTTDFAETWQKILADGTGTIEGAAKALGVMRIGKTASDTKGPPEIGFAVGEKLVYGLAFTLPASIKRKDGPVVVTFDPDEWSAEFQFTEKMLTPDATSIRIARAIYFAPNDDNRPSPALFELAEHDTDAHPPLILNPAGMENSAGGNYIAVLGYPMPDTQLPKALIPPVLGETHGIKRAAPGRLRAISGGGGPAGGLIYANRVTFEAMTMAGTGGGPLIDLHTRRLIGVNYAGNYQGAGEKLGYALPIGDLLPVSSVRDIFAETAGTNLTFAAVLPAVETEIATRTATAAVATGAAVRIPDNANEVQRLEAFGPLGYRPDFLGPELPLPVLPEDAQSVDLDYLHAQVALNPERRLAWYAVANVDGTKLQRPNRPRRSFIEDPRTPAETQTGNDLYRQSPLDRGHLLSRYYLSWGSPDEAREASQAVGFAPNVSPQHERMNRRAWLNLELLVRDTIETGSLRATVFAGPVFETADPFFREAQIPQSFWKIIVTAGPKGSLRASGFLLRQSLRIKGGEIVAVVPDFDPAASRVSIADIEAVTGLDFGPLRDAPSVF